MKRIFEESELIINDDGSIFHLHLHPENLADNVILVGDPGRAPTVARHFEKIECDIANREFRTITGTYKNKRISVISTGIGCDNIDIVLNEIDALANIDFSSRAERADLRSLNIIRIGTCGGLQETTPVGTLIASVKSIGFDGLLNFYSGRNAVCDLGFEKEFMKYMNWEKGICIANPYIVEADPNLLKRIASDDMVKGVTVSCGGFYGPQGRRLRIPLADPEQNNKIIQFRYKEHCITNFEMESSAVAGLSKLLGHKALTCCLVIANRFAKKADTHYKNNMDALILKVLDRI